MVFSWLFALFKRPTLLAQRLVVYAYVLEDGTVCVRGDYGSLSKAEVIMARPDRGRYVIGQLPSDSSRWVVIDLYRGWQQERFYQSQDAAVVATVMRAGGRDA